MCRRLIFLLLLLAFGLTASAQATTVVWVSDNKTPSGGIPADQGWVDLLRTTGYTVNYTNVTVNAGYWNNIDADAAKLAALNAADLIIVSRDLNSGSYTNNATEMTRWNTDIKKPFLSLIAHMARSNGTLDRWRWLNCTGQNTAQPTLQAVIPTHPVFKGVTLNASNQVNILTTQADISNATAAGNGTLIATRADNSQVWIAEWPAGVEFYAGSGYTTGSKRMLFCAGTDGGTDGQYNLNADGEKMFLNAVKYLSGYVQTTAIKPVPADGTAVPPTGKVTGGVYMLLTFTAGETAISHTAYFSADFDDVNDRSPAVRLGSPPYPDVYPTSYYVGFNAPEVPAFARVPLAEGRTYYWATDESDGVSTFPGKVWSFMIVPEQAWDPNPVDGDQYVNADPNVALSWKLGSISTTGYNVSYDVYYGTVFADVNTSTTPNVHVIPTNAVTGSLPANTVYYWRVDTVLTQPAPPWASTRTKGDVWSFKTLPVVAITDPDLIGWWKLDGDIVPAIAFDSSGYANHGTLRGGPQWVSDEKLGGALAFDGVDDIVVVEQSRGLPIYNNGTDNAYSVAIWVKGGPQADRRVFSEGSTTSNTPLFNLGTQNAGATGQFDVLIRPDSGTTLNHAQSQAEPFDYTWHHVAWVDDNGTAMLYVDGVLDGTNFNYTRGTMALNTTSIGGILRAAPSYFFAGEIADVRVYKRVLSAREVKVIAGLLKASSPDPANLATGVARTPTLSWEAGAYAANLSGHNLYFSDNRDSVINRTTAKIVRTDPCYPVATTLDLGKAYYWAVDEVNGLNVWPGHLWSFTTVNYLVVDDMEKYQPNVPSPSIYQVWVDGAGDCASIPGNNSGALVDISTLAALTPVHGDQQAMKLLYDNDGTVNNPCPPGVPTARLTYSKAEALVAQLPSGIGSDWTAGGVTKALSLWFYGDPLNSIEPMWVRLTDASNNTAKVLYGKYADEDVKDVNEASWHEWLISLADFTGVNVANVKSIAIGIGNETGPAGGSGTLYFDDIRLYTPRCVLARRSADFAAFDYAPAGNPAGDCVIDYRELELMTQDWLLNDYNVAGDANLINFPTDNSQWVAGKKNNALNFDGVNDQVYAQRVYLPRSAFSVGMWINPRIDLGPTTRRMDLIYWGVGNRPHLTFNKAEGTAGAIGLWPNVGAADFNGPLTVTTSWTANTWYHIAATFNGTDFKIYANGALEGTVNNPGTHSAASGPRIGSNNAGANNFDGRVDDFRIYNYALSDSDVAKLANQTGEPAAGPLFWFKFDETSGNTADESVGTVIYVPLPRPAIDLYGDGIVNFKDYAVLVTRWLDEDLYP